MRHEPPSRVGLLQGTLELLILRSLLAGPTHGHAIAKHIQRTSEDLLQGRDGVAVPGASSSGGERMGCCLVGIVGEGQACQVLSPHAARAQTAGCRTIEVGNVFPRHGIGPEPGR